VKNKGSKRREEKNQQPSTRTRKTFLDADTDAFLDELPEIDDSNLARWQEMDGNNENHHFKCIQCYHRLSRSSFQVTPMGLGVYPLLRLPFLVGLP
jgi:hypothetical protein